jgi:hypothetical protein
MTPTEQGEAVATGFIVLYWLIAGLTALAAVIGMWL